MDHELPDAEREKIKTIVMAHPEVISLHDLRTRTAGLHTFIQIHIELDPRMALMEAHRSAMRWNTNFVRLSIRPK